MLLEALKKILKDGYSIYNISYLIENNETKRCYKIHIKEHEIILTDSYKSEEEDNLIMDVGDLYLNLTMYKNNLPSTVLSKSNNKEYIYTGFVVNKKKEEIIFSWHADNIKYHF